jgi:hypothetical protein
MATFTNARKDRLIHERVHDPYKSSRKPPEPRVCPTCHAVFKGGRWQWAESRPMDSHEELCQACKRVRDNYPAGLVRLSGNLVKTHRAELLNLVRNQEKNERALHPLHRVIKIEEHADEVTVSTTDIHLPKRIGEALHRAYKGRLDLAYEKESCFVRASWTSNM